MIKITTVAPYKEFADLFTQIFEKHNLDPSFSEFGKENCELEIFVTASSTELQNRKFNSDVIVARSGLAYYIKKVENTIPVVEIPVAGNDLIHALYECKQRFDSKEVAVIGSTNMIIGAERLSHIVGMNIVTFLSLETNKAGDIVKEVMRKGIDTIISGVKTCEYANMFGAKTVLIKSGSESIWQAISEAKRIAYISRHEQEKAERYKTIIDYAFEGVIAVDNENMISVINTAAQKTLQMRNQNLIGKTVYDILPKSGVRDILDNDSKCLDELVKYNDIQLAANMVPIELKGERVGKVLTFQDVTKIQETESKIREKIYTRGHVAKHTFNSIIGDSKKIKEIIQTSQDFAMVDSNILIHGETGTGKELFAQSIHNSSNRRKGPFVAVNCAALPESLLESELFGYAEGAFTGALKGGKPGLFELAHRGTIFLDEISETHLKLQGQLLRVLQEKEIRRIGHDRVIHVDVRVITATNKNLSTLVQAGQFREDLFYRLNVLIVNLPSLRERDEDILIITDSFIKEYSLQFGREVKTLTSNAKKVLMSYDWPGNIRQLKNICERLVVSNRLNMIDEEDLKKVLLDFNFKSTSAMSTSFCSSQEKATKKTADFNLNNDSSYLSELKQLERSKIISALEKTGYTKAKAARLLGINRTTLWRRMKELGIEDLSVYL
jgi:PAS domain S-box-containing protein